MNRWVGRAARLISLQETILYQVIDLKTLPDIAFPAVDTIFLLTPRTGGHHNRLQQHKHQEKLHPGTTFRDKPQSA